MPYPRQGLEAQVVPFYSLNVVITRKSPVSIHDECDMLRDRALLEGPNEKFP